jgi:YVTN family beta-propeller protein
MILRRALSIALATAVTGVLGATAAGMGAPAVAEASSLRPTAVKAVIPHDEAAGIGSAPIGVAVSESRQQAYVANYASGTVSVVDTTDNSVPMVVGIEIGAGPTGVAVDEETHQAFVTNYIDGTLSVIDTDTDMVSRVIGADGATGHAIGSGPEGVAVDSAGRQVYVANTNSDSVSVLDSASGHVTAVIPYDAAHGIGRQPINVAVDSRQHRAYVTNYADDTVSVINTTTNTVDTVLGKGSGAGIGGHPLGVAVDEISSQAYVANANDGTVSVIDTTTDDVTKVIGHDMALGIGTYPFAVAVDAAQRRAYVTNDADGTVSIIDTATDEVTTVIGHDSATGIGALPQGVAIDPVSGQGYVANEADGTVSVLRVQPTAPVVRIAGADRYAGSAAVSSATFDPGVPAVFIASGENFPDALAAAGVAGSESSPVLLVGRDSIPVSVAAELARLKPRKIVIMGGASTIADSVQSALGAYSANVSRIDGADRYAVSAALSAKVFSPDVPFAVVASGESFPDALSGSAMAGHGKWPVLLVPHDGIPDSVKAELSRLRPKRIIVLGGVNTVSDATFAALQAIAPPGGLVGRLAGADRYDTSAAISASSYAGGTKTVYVASGENFPDALSGSPAAIVENGPVLLVTKSSVPDAVKNELRRLKPDQIIVLGGPGSVSDAVLFQLAAFVG